MTLTARPSANAASQRVSGQKAHCTRVAAWCAELANTLQLPSTEKRILREAALLHHDNVSEPAFDRMLDDLRFGTGDESARTLTPVQKVVQGLDGHRSGLPPALQRLCAILEAANFFDEQLEFSPFMDGDGLARAFDEADHLAHVGILDSTVVAALRKLQRTNKTELLELAAKLPPYPAIAMKAMKMLAREDFGLWEFETIAKGDQSIAGCLLRTANSVHFSPQLPVRSIAQAVGFMGTNDVRQILSASVIKPLFSSSVHQKLWAHSLESAQLAEKIAELSDQVNPAEAFLAGLIHDLGRLLMSLLPVDAFSAYERLVQNGCEPMIAEWVVCGADHAEIGAELLRMWKFPDDMVAGVADHHQPERSESAVAGVLYLTEFWSNSEEDLPSSARLKAACSLAGVPPEKLRRANPKKTGSLESLV